MLRERQNFPANYDGMLRIGNKVLQYCTSIHRRKVLKSKKKKTPNPALTKVKRISNTEKFTDEMI